MAGKRTTAARGALVLLAVAAGSFPGGKARGFSLGIHRLLTDGALAQVQACRGKLGDGALDARIDALAAAQELLLRCNLDQDSVVRKAALWHFLPARDRPALDPAVQNIPVCPLEPSLRPWFDALASQADGTTHPEQAYALLGAMLHYIQDMAVPSHVVPIFHPTGWVCPDAFDGKKVKGGLELAADCQALAQGDQRPLSLVLANLLDATAAYTLKVITSNRAAESSPASWSLFWPAGDQVDGFGRYGCVGNEFGTPDLRCGGIRLRVEPATYDELAKDLQQRAMAASAAAIVAVLRRIPPPTGPAGGLCPLPMPCTRGGLCGARPEEWQARARWSPFATSDGEPIPGTPLDPRCASSWRLSFASAAYVSSGLVIALLLGLVMAVVAGARRLLRRLKG